MKLSDHQVRIVNAFLRDAALETPAEPPSARTRVLTHLRRQLRDELARRNDSQLRDDELIRLLNRIQFPDRAKLADAALYRGVASGDDSAAKNDLNGLNGSNGGAAADPDSAAAALVESAAISPVVSSEVGSGGDSPAGAIPSNVRRSRQPLPSGPLASSQRIWLGVCIAIAEKFDLDVDHVRIGAFVIGLLTGPVAVALYLAWYAVFYLGEHGAGAPRANRAVVLRATVGAVAVFVLMGIAFALAIFAVDFVHALAIGYPPNNDEWSSFAQGANRILAVTAMLILPFAVLRGLPVAPPWDLLLPRLLRAAFMGVAALLALAFASYLTGALLSGISDWPA